jgi:biopolymer transport protein TolR
MPGPQAQGCKFCQAISGTRGQRQGKGERMALAKRNEGAKVNSDINVTPMVDVMLVLLIIFMVVTPMLQKGVSVDLAKVNNPEQMPDADKEDALLVAVMRTGDVFFGNDKISPDQLTGKIKDRIANRADKRVYIRADARAKFGRVVEVVDNIRAAGVDQLGLLTDQRKEKPAATAPPTTPAGGQ